MQFFRNRIDSVVLLLAMVLSAWAAISWNPVVTWDLKNYHLYSGYAFLHKPFHFDFAPGQVQSFFNPLLHVPTYLAFEYLPEILALALLGAVQGINVYFIFRIGRVLFSCMREPLGTILSLACASAGFYGAANLGELGTTFADNLLSILVLPGILMLIQYLHRDSSTEPRRSLPPALAGALIGAAFGLKLNIGPYAFAAAVAFLAALAIRKAGIRPVLIFSGCLALAFFCLYGFWGILLYREYHNPLFPYFNELFRSPFYEIGSASDARFLPRNLTQAFFYPFFFAHRNTLVCETPFRDIRLAVCYVSIALVATVSIWRFLRRGRRAPGLDRNESRNASLLFLTVFFMLSYISWQQLFSIYRYLVPLEFLAPLLITLCLAYMFRQPVYSVVGCLMLSAWILAAVVPIDLSQRGIGYESLKFSPPSIKNLDRGMVLMCGEEPTSYVVTRFPSTTRFVRISSNFLSPGRNQFLDTKIRRIISQYSPSHKFAYFANVGELRQSRSVLAYYGLRADEASCITLRSSTQAHGLLCRTAGPGESAPESPKLTAEKISLPVFYSSPTVRLRVYPRIVRAGKDHINFQVIGLKAAAVDMLYTVNGRQMPPILNWRLDSKGRTGLLVGASSEKGFYHILGIRNSAEQGDWIETDITAEIR